MSTSDVSSRIWLCGCLLLLGMTTAVRAEEPPRPMAGAAKASGVVTGIIGAPVRGGASAAAATLKVGDVIEVGDELRMGPGQTVDLLWDHRAVVTLHEESRAHIREPQHGQTEIQLDQGGVRIALSYSAGRMTDTLTLQTPLARVVTRGGILEASALGGERRSLLARLVNRSPVDTLRVLEGQARVESLTGQAQPFTLKTGSEVSLSPEMVGAVSELAKGVPSLRSLAVREEHRVVPGSVARQIANAQIGVALELEKEFRLASTTGGEKEMPGSGVKGVVLATSTGVPVAVGFPTSVATTSTLTSFTPPTSAATTPFAGAGTVGPSQSGGLNTRELLRQILNDVERTGKGRGKLK